MQIITLCGSTRFKDEFLEAQKRLSLEGHIVHSVPFFTHADNISITQEEENLLQMIHLIKIGLSYRIHVINPGGYIGESTAIEIQYANKNNKVITYEFLEYANGR